jgi:hypothetical protein
MAIEVYKILNKKSPMYLNDLFVYKESRYSFRKTNTVEVPQVRTTYHGLHSFRFAGATLCNELLNELRNVSSLAYYRQTYKAMHYINKSHAYDLATKTSKIKIKMKALSK